MGYHAGTVSRLGLVVLAAWCASAGPCAAAWAAPTPPPLVVYWAPTDAPAEVAEARAAIEGAARAAGTTVLDVSPPAPAPPAAPAHLARGVEAYGRVRWDEALEALDAGLADAARTGAAGLQPADLSDLMLYRALVHTQKGDKARAWEDLVRAATVDPTRQIDPARFPPTAVEAFRRAADQVAAAPRGTFAVRAPAGCRVVVDARDVTGAPPALPYGEHYVRIDCPGARPFGAAVVLSQATQPLEPALEPIAPPTEAQVAALGRERGAQAVLWTLVAVSASGPPTVWMRVIDVASGRVVDQAVVALSPGGGASPDAQAAVRRLIARVVGPPPEAVVVRERPRRWHERPWVWGAVGVALGAAALLPFVFDDGGRAGVDVRPTGDVWR